MDNDSSTNKVNNVLAWIVVVLSACVVVSAGIAAYLWLRSTGTSRAAQQMAYVTVANGQFDLYFADATGRHILALAKTDQDELYPSWSPDGTAIAYVRLTIRAAEGGQLTPGSGVCLLGVDKNGKPTTAEPVLLADAQESGLGIPSWSPDGNTIAYVAAQYPGPEGGPMSSTLNFITVASRVQETIPVTPSVSLLDSTVEWAPDGFKVAFVGSQGVVEAAPGPPSQQEVTGDTTPCIWVYDLRTRSLSLVATNAAMARWSPRGDFLAYVGTNDTVGVELVRPDGTDQRQLLSEGFGGSMAWSPDGERLAVSVGSQDGSQIDVFSVDSGESTVFQVATAPTSPSMFAAWSPDGKYISYTVFTSETAGYPEGSLWIMDAKTGTTSLFPDNPGMEALAVWRPQTVPQGETKN